MGVAARLGGFRYLPRTGVANGTIAQWRFLTSIDGVNWTQVAQGNFAHAGRQRTEKTVLFNTAPPPNQPPTLAAIAQPEQHGRQTVSLAAQWHGPEWRRAHATRRNRLARRTSPSTRATGPITGGTPAAGSSFNVSGQVSDGAGRRRQSHFHLDDHRGHRSRSIRWLAPPAVAGSTVTLTASTSGGANLRYRWNFGDGTPDGRHLPRPSATHVYSAAGLYTVT